MDNNYNNNNSKNRGITQPDSQYNYPVPYQGRSIWDYKGPVNSHDSQIEHLKKYNENQRTLKEASKHQADQFLNQHISNIQHDLAFKVPIKLSQQVQQNYNLDAYNEEIMDVAKSMVDNTRLDIIGIYIQILGAIAIATWGRVILCPRKGWKESTVCMILQIAFAGGRKSFVIDMLKKAFMTFCNKKNKIREIDREKTAKLKKTAEIMDKEHRRRLATQTKEYDYLNENSFSELLEKTNEYEENMRETRSKIEIPAKVRILADSLTSFGLRKTLSEQGESCGCITAESEMFQGQLLKKGADPAFFNKLHTQETHVKSTMREDITLNHPAFSMVNFVQPSVAQEFYSGENLHNLGVTGRFMPYFHNLEDQRGDDSYDNNY